MMIEGYDNLSSPSPSISTDRELGAEEMKRRAMTMTLLVRWKHLKRAAQNLKSLRPFPSHESHSSHMVQISALECLFPSQKSHSSRFSSTQNHSRQREAIEAAQRWRRLDAAKAQLKQLPVAAAPAHPAVSLEK
ncbi:hypothetical protein F2P56_003575 [Juglans regia]|uniref:Uncharacterized protein n=1 Tax=Juglans regia TaxID=51240 RepID=A0A833Y6L9_JUGRE|nr:hypothetical protein F2P56_003575 [Juglans regia]